MRVSVLPWCLPVQVFSEEREGPMPGVFGGCGVVGPALIVEEGMAGSGIDLYVVALQLRLQVARRAAVKSFSG